jgi:hypothetical protein
LLASLVLLEDEVYLISQTIRKSLLNNLILKYNLSEGIVMDEIIYNILLLNLASNEPLVGKLYNHEVIEIFEKLLSIVKKNSNISDVQTVFDNDNRTFHKEDTKIINFITFSVQQKISNGIFTQSKGKYENMNYIIFNSNHELIKKN